MNALTVRQPWASAIMELGKDVENRTWSTSYRGWLAIHAGKSVDVEADLRGHALDQRLPSGCILGVVELRDIIKDSKSRWAEAETFHWVLGDPRPLAEPIPFRGRQHLFKLPQDLAKLVATALALPHISD